MARPKNKTDLTIRRVRLADLHHDPANARTHDTKNLRTISGSLKEFGQVEPLIVQKSTGRVIGGNGRLTALLEMGAEEAYVNELDVDDLTATRLSLTLNRSAELGGWNDDGLASLLQSLSEADRVVTGFDDGDLAALIEGLAKDAAADGGEMDAAGSEDLPERWMVVIECKGEAEQVALIERFQAEGLECRAMVS